MKTVSDAPSFGGRGWRRGGAALLLLSLLGLIPVKGLSQAAPASPAVVFPAWLVPVVRVLDDGRVVPTTGVVLAENAVLVPSEFTAGDGALFVLDGGADLPQHGRSAAVSRRLPLVGLAVLEVPGLRRSPPRLASAPLRDGQGLLLQALAPPELLVRGEARVQRAGRVSRSSDDGVSLDPLTPLPNVTGVLVDGCGQWAGYSAARGAASMATSSTTLYQWVPALTAKLADAGFPLESGTCSVDVARAAPAQSLPDPVPESPPESGANPPAEPELEPTPAPEALDEPGPEPVDQTGGAETDRDLPELTPDPEPFPGPPPAADSADPDLPEQEVQALPGVLSRLAPWAIGALMLALAGVGVRRFGRPAPAAATEPAAYVLEADSGRLLVPARGGRVDCTVGRYDVDVIVDGASVSRRHARLFGTAERLQLVDLESTNGTWLNGEPCAPGVVVSVTPGDQLRFGDQEFTLQSARGLGA